MKQKFQQEGVNTRIMLIMKEKNLNKNSLSKLLGISQPALKKIESNENLPSFKLLFELLSNFQDINPEWLITGNGSMYKSDSDHSHPVPTLVDSELFVASQKQVGDLINMLKQSQRQLDDVMKMYTQLLEREKGGGVVHRGNDAECADVG